MNDGSAQRRSATYVPLPREDGWLALVDDELLFRIEALRADHDCDEQLIAVVRSDRHFFVRQEAAKRIHDTEKLKAFAADRHIGQILARQMRREADISYLEHLIAESRHLEVRKAAQVQLRQLRQTLGIPTPED